MTNGKQWISSNLQLVKRLYGPEIPVVPLPPRGFTPTTQQIWFSLEINVPKTHEWNLVCLNRSGIVMPTKTEHLLPALCIAFGYQKFICVKLFNDNYPQETFHTFLLHSHRIFISCDAHDSRKIAVPKTLDPFSLGAIPPKSIIVHLNRGKKRQIISAWSWENEQFMRHYLNFWPAGSTTASNFRGMLLVIGSSKALIGVLREALVRSFVRSLNLSLVRHPRNYFNKFQGSQLVELEIYTNTVSSSHKM